MSSSDKEIEEWLPLAKYIANKYAKYYGYKEFDDAYQEACTGLFRALRTWKGGTDGKSAYLAKGMKLTMLKANRKKQIKAGTLDTGLIEAIAVEDGTDHILDKVSIQQASKTLSLSDKERLRIILKHNVVFREAAEEMGICKQRLSQIWKRMKEKMRQELVL